MVTYCKLALYADDTVLYLANINFGITAHKMQEDINALSSWCMDNCIQMNMDKTKVMLFGNANKLEQLPLFEIKVNNILLQIVPNYKYLGMTLDHQLNYNAQVQKIISIVRVKLKQFRRMRFLIDVKSVRELHGEGKILQLKHRRELHLLSYMYDMSRVPSKLKRTRKVGVKTTSQNKKLQRIRKTNNSLVNEK